MRKSKDFHWVKTITLEFPQNNTGYTAFVWVNDNYYQILSNNTQFVINKIFTGAQSSQYETDYTGTNLKITFSLVSGSTFIGNVEWVNSNWNVY